MGLGVLAVLREQPLNRQGARDLMPGPGVLTVLMWARSGGRVAPVRLRTRLTEGGQRRQPFGHARDRCAVEGGCDRDRADRPAQGDQRGAHGGAQRADSGGVLLIGDGTASAPTLAFLPLVAQARDR